MTQLLSSQGIDISQKNFQQIIIRGDGKDQFNQKINQEISTFPPSKNLEVTTNHKFIFAKNYIIKKLFSAINKTVSQRDLIKSLSNNSISKIKNCARTM